MRLVKFLLLTMGATIFLAAGANAQTAVEGGTGLFFVDKAATLGDGAIGVGLHLGSERYWIGDQPATETVYTGSVTAGFGDRFELSVAAPYRSRNTEGGLDDSGIADGMLKAKYQLFHHQEYGLRLSVAALLTLPLGDKNKGFGAEQAFPGAAVMLDKEYEDVTWSFNVGYVAANKAELGFDPYTIYGAGVEWFPTETPLALITEISGRAWSSVLQGRDDFSNLHFGARYYINDNVTAQAAYGSWTGGSYASYRYVAGVTVGFGLGRKTTGATTGVVPVTVAPTEETTVGTAPTMTITLGTAHFQFDHSTLTAEAKKVLDENAAALREHPTMVVVIEGHTDSKGSKAYNQKLGLRRAVAAKVYLTEQGVAADRMSVVSYGEERPVADNATPEGQAKNRRADFVIQDK